MLTATNMTPKTMKNEDEKISAFAQSVAVFKISIILNL
jgi:hypothetical protein